MMPYERLPSRFLWGCLLLKEICRFVPSFDFQETNGQLEPYQEFRLIYVNFLCHNESLYDCLVLLPWPIKDGFQPVFHMTMFPLISGRQILLRNSKFKRE